MRIIRNDGQPRDAVSLSVEGALVTVFRSGAITYRCPLLAREVDVGSQGAVDAEVDLCGFVPCQQAVCVIDRVGLGVAVVDVAQILGCAALAAAVSPFTDSATL